MMDSNIEVAVRRYDKETKILFEKRGDMVRAIFAREELETTLAALRESQCYVEELLSGTCIPAKECGSDERC